MPSATLPVDLHALTAPPAISVLQRIGDGYSDYQAVRAGFASGLFDWLNEHGPAEKTAIAQALELRGAHLGFPANAGRYRSARAT